LARLDSRPRPSRCVCLRFIRTFSTSIVPKTSWSGAVPDIASCASCSSTTLMAREAALAVVWAAGVPIAEAARELRITTRRPARTCGGLLTELEPRARVNSFCGLARLSKPDSGSRKRKATSRPLEPSGAKDLERSTEDSALATLTPAAPHDRLTGSRWFWTTIRVKGVAGSLKLALGTAHLAKGRVSDISRDIGSQRGANGGQ
jgi:hypothetical protein